MSCNNQGLSLHCQPFFSGLDFPVARYVACSDENGGFESRCSRQYSAYGSRRKRSALRSQGDSYHSERPVDQNRTRGWHGNYRLESLKRSPARSARFMSGGRPVQNCSAPNDFGPSKSAETLVSRQRSASAVRAASACAAYLTASLPSKRCAGR